MECVELQTKLSDLKQGILGCHAHQSTYETRQRLKGLGGRPTGFIRLASERISCSMIFPPEATYLADLSTSRTASSLLTLISLVSVSFFSHLLSFSSSFYGPRENTSNRVKSSADRSIKIRTDQIEQVFRGHFQRKRPTCDRLGVDGENGT